MLQIVVVNVALQIVGFCGACGGLTLMTRRRIFADLIKLLPDMERDKSLPLGGRNRYQNAPKFILPVNLTNVGFVLERSNLALTCTRICT